MTRKKEGLFIVPGPIRMTGMRGLEALTLYRLLTERGRGR
jgi:hypothetical protein